MTEAINKVFAKVSRTLVNRALIVKVSRTIEVNRIILISFNLNRFDSLSAIRISLGLINRMLIIINSTAIKIGNTLY